MLLKPTEIEYIELEEEQEDELEASDAEAFSEQLPVSGEIKDNSPYILGRPILIGGTEEPIYLDQDISFIDAEEDDEDDYYLFGGEPVVIGGDSFIARDDYDEQVYDTDELISDFDENINQSLYDLDSEFGDDFLSGQDFPTESEIEDGINFGGEAGEWEETKHKTLIGKVDSQLLSKIREYRENVHEMSEEKLSAISSQENRDKLLTEAALLVEEVAVSRDINSLIAELDKKMSNIIKRHIDLQLQGIRSERETMLYEVEREVEQQITEQIELIKSEAEEHIDETVQYYKKKLEGDNQVLSTANNIISRREQILDEAYAKSLGLVEDSEEKAREIIEKSAHAQEEAESIIAEAEAKRDDIMQEAEIESERIISDANLESARIIQAAEDQHQDIVEAATQDGFSVGYQEGKEEAIKENSELLREAISALNKLHAAFPVSVKQNEDKLVKIAYQISNSMIGEPVMERPELCQKAITVGMRQVSDFDLVKVKVNPSDLDVILPKQEYFKMIIPDVQEYIINGDNNVSKGGCVISTETEVFNVSINTQLSILEAVFNEALSEIDE